MLSVDLMDPLARYYPRTVSPAPVSTELGSKGKFAKMLTRRAREFKANSAIERHLDIGKSTSAKRYFRLIADNLPDMMSLSVP